MKTPWEVLTEQGREYWKGEAERLSAELETVKAEYDASTLALREQLANVRAAKSLHASRVIGAEIQRDEANRRADQLEAALRSVVKAAEDALYHYDDAA